MQRAGLFHGWCYILSTASVEPFAFPFAETGRKEIAAWELAVLLEGIDLSQGRRRKRYSLPSATQAMGNGQAGRATSSG